VPKPPGRATKASAIEHPRLAFVHVRDHFQPGHALVRDFPLHQLFGDHADHFAAVVEHGVGDDAHETDVAAAVDQLQAFGRDARAERAGAFGVDGFVAGVGAAVDADRFHGIVQGIPEKQNGAPKCAVRGCRPIS
jgi:hypothetical protein